MAHLDRSDAQGIIDAAWSHLHRSSELLEAADAELGASKATTPPGVALRVALAHAHAQLADTLLTAHLPLLEGGPPPASPPRSA